MPYKKVEEIMLFYVVVWTDGITSYNLFHTNDYKPIILYNIKILIIFLPYIKDWSGLVPECVVGIFFDINFSAAL
jgi:hypothetical protein